MRPEALRLRSRCWRVRRLRGLGPGNVVLPYGAAIRLEVAHADPDVDLPGQHGVPDGTAPQHARLAGLRVEVSQLAQGASGLRHRVLVVGVGQCRTGAVRISEPLPAVRPVSRCNASDSSRVLAAVIVPLRAALARTRRVWMPTSGEFCAQ